MDKIDIYNSEARLKAGIEGIKTAKIKNKKLLLEYDKSNFAHGIGYRYRLKALKSLRVVDSWFNKDFTRITRKDMEDIILKLREDKIKKVHVMKGMSSVYSETTKNDYLKVFRKFMRWLFREGKYKGDLQNFLSDFSYKQDRNKKKQPDILSLDQVSLLCDKLKSLKYRTAVLVFFDSGARPEELANIRIRDIEWDIKTRKYWTNIRYEKLNSHPRKIDLPYCTELLKKYLSSERKSAGPDEPLFIISLKKLRDTINPVSKKLFGHNCNLYTLRHSSIQNYYDIYKGNLLWMANRYGWSYGNAAKELGTYANRSKVSLPDGSELAHQDKLGELTIDKTKMQTQIDIMSKQIENLEKMISFSQNLDILRADTQDEVRTFVKSKKVR